MKTLYLISALLAIAIIVIIVIWFTDGNKDKRISGMQTLPSPASLPISPPMKDNSDNTNFRDGRTCKRGMYLNSSPARGEFSERNNDDVNEETSLTSSSSREYESSPYMSGISHKTLSTHTNFAHDLSYDL